MLTDIMTIIWKEVKISLQLRENYKTQMLSFLGPIMLAVLLPLDYGSAWVEGHISLFIAVATPLTLIGGLVPSSFAGEKEGHTLETLLASRLSDQAILFGKSLFIILYGWLITLVILSFSLITVNLTTEGSGLLLYQPNVLLANIILSLLLSSLFCGVGVLISLRSDTVQEASQTLMGMLLIPPSLIGALALISGIRPKVILAAYEPWQLLTAFSIVLFVITVILFMVAQKGFKRSQLIAAK